MGEIRILTHARLRRAARERLRAPREPLAPQPEGEAMPEQPEQATS
jgi:hypothetical protein